VKQARPVGGTMPPCTIAVSIRERGQPSVEVSPNTGVAEVSPDVLSSVLAKRKQDDDDGVSGHKKSRAHSSLRAMREAVRLTLGSGCPLSLQDPPPSSSIIQAFVLVAAVIATPAPPPSPAMFALEISTSPWAEVSALATLASTVDAPLFIVVVPLLSTGVATTSASMVPHSSSPLVPSLAVLVSTSPSTSSQPSISLDHIYTSCDVCSLWGVGYKLEHNSPVGFVITFDKNLIC